MLAGHISQNSRQLIIPSERDLRRISEMAFLFFLGLGISIITREFWEAVLHMHFLGPPKWLDQPETPPLGFHNFYLPSISGNNIGVWSSFGESNNCSSVIIFIHGQLGSRGISHRREAVEIFHEINVCAITYDPSGYGDSTGWPDSESLKKDSESILKWVAGNVGGIPIHVWGHSMGGLIASYMASRFPEISGLVLESTFAEIAFPATFGLYGSWLFFIPENTRLYLIREILGLALNGGLDSVQYLREIPENVKILLLHGDQDWTVPVSSVNQMEQILRDRQVTISSIDTFIIKGGFHNNIHTFKHSKELIPRLRTWLNLGFRV